MALGLAKLCCELQYFQHTEFTMTSRKCLACGQFFKPRPQTREQTYCSNPDCQRERRRRSKQQQRLASASLNSVGAKRKSEYWRKYREQHPGYVERNRVQQQYRNRRNLHRSKTNEIARLPPGRYLITRLDGDIIAKGHAWLAEIRILSAFPEDG